MTFSRNFRVELYCLNGVGPKTYQSILSSLKKHETSPKEFWDNKANIWSKIPINKSIEKSIKKRNKEQKRDAIFTQYSKHGIRVVFREDAEYPSLLKEVDQSPPIIFVKGKFLSGFGNRFLSVVGTRSVTPYGQRVVRKLIPGLVEAGFTIVSGFMYGVDVAAQQCALDSGGRTIGVLGFGFEHMFPQEHTKVMENFLKRGASFISPFAPSVAPNKGTFVARNSVVAGLSQGVLVVEAAQRSGSLITARLSGEYGRETFVVAGSIFNRYAEGMKQLANQGAKVITRVEDMIEEFLKVPLSAEPKPTPTPISRLKIPSSWQKILEYLEAGPASVTDMARALEQEREMLSRHLIELEIEGLVSRKGLLFQRNFFAG